MIKILKKTAMSVALVALFGSTLFVTTGCDFDDCSGDKAEEVLQMTYTDSEVTETGSEESAASTETSAETKEEEYVPLEDVPENLSEFDQFRAALSANAGIELPTNDEVTVTEFFHETFDEGDTVVGGHFDGMDDAYVEKMEEAVTKVMGEPVQVEENDDFKFYVWSLPTDKEGVVDEMVIDRAPDGGVSVKYHKDLDMNY